MPKRYRYNVLLSLENETTKMDARHGVPQRHSLNSYDCKLPHIGMRIALHDCANWIECNLRKCNILVISVDNPQFFSILVPMTGYTKRIFDDSPGPEVWIDQM